MAHVLFVESAIVAVVLGAAFVLPSILGSAVIIVIVSLHEVDQLMCRCQVQRRAQGGREDVAAEVGP